MTESHKLFGDINAPSITKEDVEKHGFKPEQTLMTQEASDQFFEDAAACDEAEHWPKRTICLDGTLRVFNSRAEWSADAQRRLLG